MSSIEIPPNQVFEIDPDTFEQIDKIVHDVKTRYATWYEFVNEAVKIFATWWGNPPDAQKIMQQELWPHMTSEQHNIMKDPKFGGIKIYETFKKRAEEYLEKKGLPLTPPEIEVDTEFQNNAVRELKEIGYLQYTIRGRRVQDIEEVLKTAKSDSGAIYYQSTHDFMKHTIRLFINFWNNPYNNVREFYEMFPFLTKKQCRLWYNLDPREEGGYMTFRKLAEAHWRSIGQELKMDDGIEQLVEQKNVLREVEQEVTKRNMTEDRNVGKKVIHAEPRGKRTEDWVDVMPFFEATKEIKKQIKNMKKKGLFEKPDDALESDTWPLIRQFYNRFFPSKLTLTVLAGMIYHESGEPVDYDDFRDDALAHTVGLSSTLKELEKNKELDRTKKISTGLPLPRHSLPANANEEQIKEAMKWESSKERFLEQYIGPTTKQWNRKNKDPNSDRIFAGALNSMGLVSITEDSDGRLKINLTKKGAEFYDIPNEILDNFPNIRLGKHKPISSDECIFLMKNVIKKKPFSLENELIKSTYDILKEGGDELVFGSELDENYEKLLKKFAKENIDNPVSRERFPKESRQATMGRLSEMGLVNWMIYSKKLEERLKIEDSRPEKYGKSCFILNESLKKDW